MFQKSLTVKDKDDILLLEIKALSKSKGGFVMEVIVADQIICLLYTSPSPRDRSVSRMPSSA